MAQMVTVGCKLPNGIVIRHGDKSVELKGWNDEAIYFGHGLTEVDKDFWDAWIKDHADFAPVKGGFIFAQNNFASAKAESKEKEKEKTGLEGIDPKKPGRGITPADSK